MTQWEVDEYDEKVLCIDDINGVKCKYIACSKERSKTYEGDMEGKHVLTTLSYKKNKVVKQSTVTTLKYNDFGMSKKEAKKTFHDHHQLKDLKGVSYSLENNHEKWVETIDINYKKQTSKKSRSTSL